MSQGDPYNHKNLNKWKREAGKKNQLKRHENRSRVRAGFCQWLSLKIEKGVACQEMCAVSRSQKGTGS